MHSTANTNLGICFTNMFNPLCLYIYLSQARNLYSTNLLFLCLIVPCFTLYTCFDGYRWISILSHLTFGTSCIICLQFKRFGWMSQRKSNNICKTKFSNVTNNSPASFFPLVKGTEMVNFKCNKYLVLWFGHSWSNDN